MIYYVDINYGVLAGNGTSASPFNVEQMQRFVQGNVVSGVSAKDGDIIKCKGSHTFDNYNYYDPLFNWKNSLTIESWESGEYWSLSANSSFVYIYPSSYINNKTFTIKNCIFNNVNCFYGYDTSVSDINIKIKNCIIYGEFYSTLNEGFTVDVYGSTFVSANALLANYITTANNNIINLYDCVFVDSYIDDNNDNFGIISVVNCVFTLSENEIFSYVSASSATFIDCQYNWDKGGQIYPEFQDITNYNINFYNYNLPITSASRYLFWQDNDYDIGFLNYYRLGAGAWNFEFLNVSTVCNLKNDYIEIAGPIQVNRYGENKLINLTNFLPQYVKQTDTSAFLYVFENYLNEMFPGENGFILSAIDLTINKLYATTSGTIGGVNGTLLDIGDRNFNFDLGTSSTSAVSTDANNEAKKIIINVPNNYYDLDPRISILEKIKRLTELQDPELIPLGDTNTTSAYDFISLLGKNLGYQINVSRDDMSYIGEIGNLAYLENNTYSAVDVGKYLRFVIANLPNWYKIKTTENAIKVLLYSFGLIGGINNYYTKDYNLYWKLDESSVKNLNEISDDYYPSPHFAVIVEIEKSLGSEISYDNKRRQNVINAINSIRPINTVFEKLGGHFEINPSINININIKIDCHFIIN